MLIRKRSTLTGKRNTMNIPVTPVQFLVWCQDMAPLRYRMPVPRLERSAQREFLISGTTPERMGRRIWRERMSKHTPRPVDCRL